MPKGTEVRKTRLQRLQDELAEARQSEATKLQGRYAKAKAEQEKINVAYNKLQLRIARVEDELATVSELASELGVTLQD